MIPKSLEIAVAIGIGGALMLVAIYYIARLALKAKRKNNL